MAWIGCPRSPVGEITRFRPADCLPAAEDILRAEGMPEPGAVPETTQALIDRARHLFLDTAQPIAVHADITTYEFGWVFAGEGRNAPDAPLAGIYPKAAHLGLFACTVGAELTETISRLFEQHDYALAYVLDAAASAGAERLADLAEQAWRAGLPATDPPEPLALLRYSPGYCGWHVTGQRRLFEYLLPADAGITLRESCLMEPLKSVSGVCVLGPASIHVFKNGFGFCAECRNPSCRARIAGLGKES